MSNQVRFHEDLPRLAAENFEIANRTCRSCGHMHALWPYIRLARASIGAESTSSPLHPLLAELIAEGRRRVLIAGSQDTGLLALVARAGAEAELDIVVLDRCPTPLESCRRLARAWALPITTLRQDLMDLDVGGNFDIVLMHGTLHYIPAERRADILARIRRVLRPAGRLVIAVHTSHPAVGDLVCEAHIGYAHWVIEELERHAIPLPEQREAFAARLRMHAEKRERREGAFCREGAFSRLQDVHSLLTAAGFSICKSVEVELRLAARVQQFLSKLSARRFVIVAESHR